MPKKNLKVLKSNKKRTKTSTKKKIALVKSSKSAPLPTILYVGEVDKTFNELLAQAKENGSPLISAPNTFIDKRGFISNLINKPVGSVVLISSEPNTVRANHWHKEDAHLCFVLNGSVHYYERPVGSRSEPTYTHVKAGELFITGPNVEHAMKFSEETLFLTLGKLSRTPTEYEADLVRLTDLLAKPSVIDDAPAAPTADTNTQPPAVA